MKPNVYFNFPVELLKNYMVNPNQVLDKVYDYALWNYANDAYIDHKTITEKFNEEIYIKYNLTEKELIDGLYEDIDEVYDKARFRLAEIKFKVSTGDVEESIEQGKNLVRLYNNTKAPFSNISTNIWFDYYKNDKTEWQHIMLLAFLAARSIIGAKKYHLLTHDFLYSRMAGCKNKLRDRKELPKEIDEYYTTYYKSRIIKELRADWHMKVYTKRGFYSSFDYSINQLIEAVERKSKDYKLKKLNDERANAIDSVKQKLIHESKKYQEQLPDYDNNLF